MTVTGESSKKVNWQSVIVYYLIACSISWPFFWWRDMQPESWKLWHVPGFIKTWSYMWGPGISAIICLLLFKKTHQRTITFFGSHTMKSLLFYCLPILLVAVVGIPGQGMNAHLSPLILGVIGFISILGEELGWRGFLQDALRPLKPLPRYLIIGLLWEIWHFTSRMGHGPLLQVIGRVLIWAAMTSLLSFLFGKATDRSRSLVVAVTLHSWVDLLAEFFTVPLLIVFVLSLAFWIWLLWGWDKKFNFGKSVR